ncbi:MAG: S1/P1 nuclease [Bacteriovoracaceae bacterium]
MKTFLGALVLFSTSAFAWGPTGHRVVGEIAEKHIKIETLAKVRKILNGETLAQVSNWPDEIKSEPAKYGHTFNWHYTDWKDDQETHNHEHSSGKLLPAIDEQIATLKDEKKTEAEKAFALKFLVHLIGDLHMPLHVGNGIDQGGNFCKVLFHNTPSNLHRVWDEDMIDFTRLSFTELTQFVSRTHGLKSLEYKQGSILDWAKESKEIRQMIYPPAVLIEESGAGSPTYCLRPYNQVAANLPKISYEYSYQFAPVMEKRLFQAGVRLAKILDDIYSAQ